MGDDHAALEAAAKILADEVKNQAAVVSQRTPGAVNLKDNGPGIDINAGHPGGRWGWDPITAYMFEEGRPHPLYGHPPWYAQRHWPFLDLAVAIAGDKAADVYADMEIDRLAAEAGLF